MTTTNESRRCDDVQMAAMARVDGEPAGLTSDEIDAHVRGCDNCRAALADLTTLYAKLDRLDYDQLDVDVWPAVHRRIASSTPPRMLRERDAILGLAVVLGAWRLAQLLLDLPAPVVNSVVPLVLIVVMLRRLTGDPFAIKVSSHQLQGEGAS
jgi:predicted anti-sigma-YlaC factor YlaD